MGRGTVSCFATTAADSPELRAAYLKAGFRRTGILKGHLRAGEARRDALLWARKLALPDDP
jgi:RimJ/RimL family protein N-acetyltransferase